MEFETSEFTIAGIRVIDSPGDDVFQISFPNKPPVSVCGKLTYYNFKHRGMYIYSSDRSAGIEFLMSVSRALIEEYLGGKVG